MVLHQFLKQLFYPLLPPFLPFALLLVSFFHWSFGFLYVDVVGHVFLVLAFEGRSFEADLPGLGLVFLADGGDGSEGGDGFIMGCLFAFFGLFGGEGGEADFFLGEFGLDFAPDDFFSFGGELVLFDEIFDHVGNVGIFGDFEGGIFGAQSQVDVEGGDDVHDMAVKYNKSSVIRG